MARRISKVGSDLVSTAAEVAANSKIIRPPKIGDLFKGKQISLDLGALSFDATEKHIDVEEALNQRIKAITGELLSQYYADEMTENEDRTGFGIVKQFISKGIGKFGFWIIVSVLAVLTFKDVVDLALDYTSDPKQSDMNIVFNESMTMPNITFCMSRPQAWSHFHINPNESVQEWNRMVDEMFQNMSTRELFLNSTWDYRLVMEAYDTVATLNSMERETTPHGAVRSIYVFKSQQRLSEKRATVKKWIREIQKRNISFEELTQKVGVETIKKSMQRFQRTTYDDNLIIKTKFRTSWISMMQFCFQPWFDTNNFQAIKDQGNFFTMILSHDQEKLNGKQVECMTVDFHGRPSSLSRFMEGKGRTRDGFNDEICVGMVHEVTVEVKAKYVMLENSESGTACNDIQPGKDNEFDCRSRCRMNMIREVCNCTALTLSYLETKENLLKYPLCDYSQCVVDVQNGNYTDEECSNKCYRDCNQIRYEIDHETKGKSVRPDLTTVYINWGSFEFLTLEQQRIWSVPTFIAALGGSIGMWLGLSILSLLQGATYIFYLLRESKKRQKKQNIYSTNPFANPFKAKFPGPPPSYEEQKPHHKTNIQIT
ncbi:hypothetical protein FO519_007956 [Halicephalobus sp. NKZ332]|nr:hypothetical protein FO519_007956 [Halicephalobus sp. NKZ332]